MNSAELEFWGDVETMREYLSWVRRPDEGPRGYDSSHGFEESVMFAESLGEAGETFLVELMKMKRASEAEHAPEAAALELAAV